MNESVSISEISSLIGVTSRTIRFWESQGLFECTRDPSSGYRIGDNTVINKIRLCSKLRSIGISIKDIKRIFESQSVSATKKIIQENLSTIDINSQIIKRHESLLVILLNNLNDDDENFSDSSFDFYYFLSNLFQDSKLKKTQEDSMTDNNLKKEFEIIELPKMRVIYNIAISKSPEEEAMGPVFEWLKEKNLLGVSRLFGGDVKPFPTDSNTEYGYGMCATIPVDFDVPAHLKEMIIPGGLYALYPSDDDIAHSWKRFMRSLKEDQTHYSDRSRLCFEEHIYYGKPGTGGYSFKINLLEPVKEINR